MAGIPVPDDMMVITKKEYQELKRESDWLACLEAAGVDNWSGYDYAISLRDDDDD
jgi:phage pi2 protein 07